MVLWIGPGVHPGGGRLPWSAPWRWEIWVARECALEVGRFGLPWSVPWRWEVALECALEVGGRVALEF